MARSDRLKVDDLTRTTMIHDPSTLSMNQSHRSLKKGPRNVKGQSVGPAGFGGAGSARLRNSSNFRAKEEEALERELLKSIQTTERDTHANSISAAGPSALRAGAVQVDDKCLSCSGAPARSLELFKAACISYKPSSVLYRKTKVSRPKLMEMRKLLLDKCEEVISSGPW